MLLSYGKKRFTGMSAEKIIKDKGVIANNIIRIMDAKGISVSDLAKKTGMVYMTVSRIVDGHSQHPSVQNIKLISNALDVDIDDLLSEHLGFLPHRPRSMPLVSLEKLNESCGIIGQLDMESHEKWLSINARKLSGGSLESSFAIIGSEISSSLYPPDSALIIDTKASPRNGDYVLVYINDEGVALKIFTYDPPCNILKSLPPANTFIESSQANLIGVNITTIMRPSIFYNKNN